MKHTTILRFLPNTEDRLCSIIMYIALAVIAILAIPMCMFLGAIIAVWSVADKIVKVRQKHRQ